MYFLSTIIASFLCFYWAMTKKKFWITIKVLVLAAVCSALVAMVHIFGHQVFHPLGIVCMTLNTMDFGAPLAGLVRFQHIFFVIFLIIILLESGDSTPCNLNPSPAPLYR
jgi:hypothetical protein